MKLPYLIAELSCNHEGNLKEMHELIDLAKNLKVNCVKIQSIQQIQYHQMLK